MPAKILALLKHFLPPLFTATLLLIIFSGFDLKSVFTTLANSKISFIFYGLLVFVSSMPIMVFRWQKLLELIGAKIGYAPLFKIFLANLPIAKISPANTGSFLRALAFKNEVPLSKGLGVIFTEAIFDFLSLAIMAIIGGFIIKNSGFITLGSILIALIILFFIFAAKIKKYFNKKWQERICNLILIFNSVCKSPKFFFKILILSVISWLPVLYFYQMLFLALGADIPFNYIFSIQPAVMLLGLLPITFSGVGVREGAMIYLYSSLADSSQILTAGIMFSFISVLVLPLLCLPLTYITLKKSYGQSKLT